MKYVAIVGSRARTDPETVDRIVAAMPADTIIVSGGAPGPDTWAEEAARKYGLVVKVIRPDLKGARNQNQRTRRYHRRNQLIVDAADEVFALVAPHRKGGTEDTIRRAQRKGVPVTLL
jgi:hypothetical protein